MDVFATFDLTQVPVGVYRLELSQSYTISKIALDSPEPIVADTQRVVATLANAFTVLEAQSDNTVMIWTVPFSKDANRKACSSTSLSRTAVPTT